MLTRLGSAGVLTDVRDGDDIVSTLASLATASSLWLALPSLALLIQVIRKVRAVLLRFTTRKFMAV